MKKTHFSSLLLCLLITSGAAIAAENTTIEDCSKLLPSDGKHYQLSLTGTITSERKFDGQLNISDNTRKPLTDEEKAKTEPFVTCIKKLIK